MIKVGDKDTIIDIVNKMSDCDEPELILDFPKEHPILHNYMSLKILKNKAWAKRITIVSSDIISKKIWTPLGIHYTVVRDEEYLKQKNYKQELLKHNFTYWEYFVFEMKKYWARLVNFIGRKTGIERLKYYNPYNTFKASGLFVLLFGVIISIGMLSFIFYFAVSKTYIYITPEIKIKTQATNIIFSESTNTVSALSQNLVVPIKKVTQSSVLSYTHKTTGIDVTGTPRARGTVLLINELKDPQTFRPKTRLQSEDGLIFETTDWVKIPWIQYDASGATSPWTIEANVIAQTHDTQGKVVWERGNIGSGTLTIPWLKFNKDKIYAKVQKPFLWGTNSITYTLSEDDIKNATKILSEMIKKDALDKLKKKIADDNQLSGIEYQMLSMDDIIHYSDPMIKPVGTIEVWQHIDHFTLSGTGTVDSYIYSKNSVLNILTSVINDSLLVGTDKLMFIDEKSVRMTTVLEKSKDPLRIKVTTEVDMGVSFDFDNNQNYYNQRLKTLILWLPNEEAINILLNDDKVSNVSIENTPFFIKRVSSNIDNLILKIKTQN